MKHSEVEIPGDNPIGELENGNGYSVAAAAAAAMDRNGSAKGDTTNGGAKKLVFFGNASRVFDLEHLRRFWGRGHLGRLTKPFWRWGRQLR